MNIENTKEIIDTVIKNLIEAGAIEVPFVPEDDTILFGNDSKLDSMGLIMLISDCEERLASLLNKELSLLLDEIQDFNEGKDYLDVKTLAGFMTKMANS